ncbi:MAG: flagellar protein FlaG [Acetivibrionales bacterium]
MPHLQDQALSQALRKQQMKSFTFHFRFKKGDNLLPSGNTEEKEYPVTGKFIPEAVEKLNRMFEESSRRFEYSVHEKTNNIIIRVIDEDTNEVIKEIPPEKILNIMASIMELAGLIVDERR